MTERLRAYDTGPQEGWKYMDGNVRAGGAVRKSVPGDPSLGTERR